MDEDDSSGGPVALGAATLTQVGQRVPVPSYDRARVSTGIVHLGVGGFHRSHQAAYLDALLERGEAGEWGITGVGLLPADEAMAEAMAAQDGLYTLVVKHADGSLEPRVVGAMVDYLFAPSDPDAVLRVMSDPATGIVSLTITEGGYHLDPATCGFDDRDEALREDVAALAADLEHARPRTAFGFLVAALARRRAAGVAPFTVMSCDNIAGNGEVARTALLAVASRCDEDLAAWVEQHVPCPSSMVDRITPATTDADREALAEQFGVLDRWPVVCESFTQWALEDHFASGRPRWEDAGVEVVDDVEAHELMKLRLLNGGHQVIAYLGILAGFTYAHEVAEDELFAGFLRDWMDEEVTPSLTAPEGVDLEAYKDTLVQRFANPQVRDTLARLAAYTSDRIPPWIVPVVRRNLAEHAEVRRSALVLAAWARYAEGGDGEVVDRRRDQLVARAARHDQDPLAFLDDRDLFGDLRDDERFTQEYADALASLRERGARATVEEWSAR